MNRLLIGALIVAGILYFLGNPGGVMRHSGGSGFGAGSGGGGGIKAYANSSRGAVKGIGNAAGGILR